MSKETAKQSILLGGSHSVPIDELCAALQTSRRGLTLVEARSRLARHGPNDLPRGEPPGALRIFVRQFANPLIYILLIAAAVSAVMRDWSDAGFIFAVLMLNAVIGSFQEYNAEKSAEALRALSVARAYVVRDGEDHEIDARDLVPGDIVLLEAGGKVPADVRLLPQGGVEVDESLLTGESMAVEKNADAVLEPQTPIGDRANTAFAGTMVTRGRAHAIVVATGLGTEIGRIARSLASPDTSRPPLLIRMERFTQKIAIAAAVTVTLLGAISVARGAAVADVFVLAVALAVSAIPEGLPVALTVALSLGARRMAGRSVIARRLAAVEALGSCTFIASDKTGTLTMNELTARKLLLSTDLTCDITGRGVRPEGEILAPPDAQSLVKRLCTASVLCNDGFLGSRDDTWVHHGDPVDVALLSMAAKSNVHRAAEEVDRPRVGEIPFEPERRFAATLHRGDDGWMTAVKGAVERVLPMCTLVATPEGDVPLSADELEERANALAEGGYRVLAIAAGAVNRRESDRDDFSPEALEGLVLLGFVGMLDPLRPEAKESVRACLEAGIQVAMVTGDHPSTALAIARELDFADGPDQIVTGTMLESVALRGDDAVDALTSGARVFARVDPGQKLEIVESLIRNGHFVAVTGDGANDASALRAAHIGVAMGEKGTDVARESAELILTDDNFASIVSGIEEGRVAYGNVRKVVYLLVSSGAAEVMLFVLAIASGSPLPLWPAQLLWLNLVTNGIQDVALAFEPGEGGELERPPRSPGEPIFDRLMVERTMVSASVSAGIGFAYFQWMLAQGWSVAQAQNGLLLLMVLFENIQAGNSRSETASVFSLSPLRNRILLFGTIGAQLVHLGAMYTPGLREVLRVQPVSLEQWLISLGLALGLLVASELHKLQIRKRLVGG